MKRSDWLKRDANGRAWELFRHTLGFFDKEPGALIRPYDRPRIAELLGLSLRTVQRHELGRLPPTRRDDDAPDWYAFALVGLAVKLGKVKVKRHRDRGE